MNLWWVECADTEGQLYQLHWSLRGHHSDAHYHPQKPTLLVTHILTLDLIKCNVLRLTDLLGENLIMIVLCNVVVWHTLQICQVLSVSWFLEYILKLLFKVKKL